MAFLVVFGLAFWNTVSPISELEHKSWPEGVLLLTATATTLSSYSRTLPFQNIFWAAIVIGVIGGAIGAVGVLTGLPYGQFFYTEAAGAKILGTLPISIPLLWVLTIFASRGVARVIFRPWRQKNFYGIWMICLTAFLSLLFDFGLEPFASAVKHYWNRPETRSPLELDGTLILNFAGWLATSLVILIFVTPMWLNKKPGPEPKEFGTFGIWTMLNVLFATAAAKNHYWLAFAVILLGIVSVLCLVIFAARRQAVSL